MRIHGHVVGLLCMVICSCRNDKQPAPTYELYQQYSVTCNITDSITTSKATFGNTSFTGHNNGVLPANYSLRLNNYVMGAVQSPGPPTTPSTGPSYYYQHISGDNSDRTFYLHKSDGTIVTNSILHDASLTINFTSAITTVSKSDTLFVPFSGGPRLEGQYVGVHISQAYPQYAHPSTPLAIGDSVLVFLPSDLSNLPNGSATLTLSRSNGSTSLEQADGRASGTRQYSVTATATVMITN